MPQQNELRVFISSTFRDLQEEREYLVKKIFPEIRALCRDRGIEFTEIDLRWGLTEEEGVQGKNIRSCLEEIDRCRPYFIGIIGERYGWVPTIYDLFKDSDLIDQYLWIEDAVAEEVSLVDMEIRYGALNSPGDAHGAFFYLRGERPGITTVTSISNGVEVDSTRLEDLKDRIRQSGLPVREFRDPATLGELVYDDLVSIIERDFAETEPPSPLEQERRSHAAFAASRRRAYIPNPANLRLLTDHVLSGTSPLVIQAVSGIGKSALLAYWASEHRRRNPDAFIVEHYVGLDAGSDDHLAIIRHTLAEIKERFAIADDLPTSPEVLSYALPTWFAQVQREPMILLIDGLNQLHGVAGELSWLPQHIPANIRLVVTVTPGGMLSTLSQRGWNTVTIPELSREEREAITVRYLHGYHKSLPPQLIYRISSDARCAQPLFLRTLLEELRLYGSHEGLEQQLDWYLSVSNIDELFQCVLQRLEEDFGAKTVREVMRLIWASRNGLTEPELVDLTLVSRMKLSTIVVSLEYHLVRREGRLTFFHGYLRSAVEQHYIGSGKEQQREHLRLAQYFSGTPATPRRADEEPWQWKQAGALEELKTCLVNIPLFMVLSRGETKYQLLGYWLTLKEHYDVVHEYRESVRAYRMTAPDAATLATVLHRIGTFLMTGGHYEGAELALRQALHIRRRVPDENELLTAETLRELGSVYYYQEKSERAEPLLQQALEFYEAHLGELHPETIQVINDLGATWYAKGDFERAEQQFTRVLQLAEQTIGQDHPRYASFVNNLGTVILAKQDYESAVPLFRRAIEITESSLGKNHPEVGVNLSNLGLALRNLEDYDATEAAYQRAITLFQRALGPSHPQVITSMLMLSALYRLQQRHDDLLSNEQEIARLSGEEIDKRRSRVITI